VCQFEKALYGPKQSGMEWYIKAPPGLKTLGFALCYCELCVCTTPGKNRIIGLYIDDMPVLGANSQAVQSTIQRISTLWEIKVLGDVGHILGLGGLEEPRPLYRARRVNGPIAAFLEYLHVCASRSGRVISGVVKVSQ
jgi:hypothetical protein